MKINHKEINLITECPFCGRTNEIQVNETDYWDWEDGALAQVAFPYLSADEREMLISGICPSCWDSMFGYPSNEEEDEDEVDADDLYPDDPSIEEEMGWSDWGYNEDTGYDPYMGCYTDDC